MKLIAVVVALSSISSTWAIDDWDPCAHLPGGTGFVNDPAACPDYFSCVNGVAFRVSCPPGFYFDEGRQVCDLPQFVSCTRCPAVGVIAIDDESQCERWILCVNGHEFPQKCGPGTAFDPRIGMCNLAEAVGCALHTCLHIPDGLGRAADPDDCYSYFYCFNGERIAFGRCNPGMAFDSVTNQCVRSGTHTCFSAARNPIRRANVPMAPNSRRH